MKIKGLLITSLILISTAVSAQDFASIFLENHKDDPNLTCITISPKMMEEILSSNVEKNNDVADIISELKSMQLLSSSTACGSYYEQALQVLKKNGKRFETYLSYQSGGEDYRIVVRKKRDVIVEMVMLGYSEKSFIVINFTGKLKPEYISMLAKTLSKHS